jgi:hypothetical protein
VIQIFRSKAIALMHAGPQGSFEVLCLSSKLSEVASDCPIVQRFSKINTVYSYQCPVSVHTNVRTVQVAFFLLCGFCVLRPPVHGTKTEATARHPTSLIEIAQLRLEGRTPSSNSHITTTNSSADRRNPNHFFNSASDPVVVYPTNKNNSINFLLQAPYLTQGNRTDKT